MNEPLIRRPLTYKFYNAAYYLIAINILVYFITYLSRDALAYLVLSPRAITIRNAYWQFVTYMFVHGGVSHILFNMLGLFFFGAHVERRMGSSEFILFYMVSGILAGVFSFVVYVATGSTNVFLLGASGAVYAVLLAYATYFPESSIYFMGLIPVKAPLLVLGYTGIAVFSQLSGRNAGVAHMTHLAGFGIALFYFLIRLGINPIDRLLGGSGGNRSRWR